MNPGKYSFTITQGATFTETWSVAGITTATGYTSQIDIRETQEAASDLILTLSTANGRTALSSNGTSLIAAHTISAADTAALDFTDAWYDWKISGPGGTVQYYLEGRVTLNRRTTL